MIPQSIRACLELDLIDIKVVVQPFSARGRWPSINVCIDGTVAFDGTVDQQKTIGYQSAAQSQQKKCLIDITYYGKTDNDTVVDSQNSILENQSVELKELWINGVDIIKTGAIHQDIGSYTMNLDAKKREYFAEQGINLNPTTSTHMFENGVWHIELDLPLLSTLTAKHNFVEPCENVDFDSIVDEIFELLQRCERLEKNA